MTIKIKVSFTLGIFFLILFFISRPNVVSALYCDDQVPCPAESPVLGCYADSIQCLNNTCSYTWSCTSACVSWTPWSPDPCTSGQQTRYCTTNTALFQIQNCGGSSGGGAYQYPTCGGGQTLVCGTDPTLYLGGGGTVTNNSGLAQCTYTATCGNSYFPSYMQTNDCAGVDTPNRGYCQVNCGCCSATDNYTKSVTYGSTYSKTVSCNSSNTFACNDWDDVYISRTPGAGSGVCYCDCPADAPLCNINTCTRRGGSYVYNDLVTCQSVTTTWSCQPTCTATSPSKPTLTSPSDGSIITDTSVTLSWNNSSQTWGTGCPSNTNQFEVYVNGSLIGTVNSSSSSVPFSGTEGTTYNWYVRAKNGTNSTNSDVWSFTINTASPWWQVKDGDVSANGNLQSKVVSSNYFILDGDGGYPGIPAYSGTFNLSTSTSLISTTKWFSPTNLYQPRLFNYNYFSSLTPDDVVFNDIGDLATGGAQYSDGYEWYKVNGNLDIDSSLDLQNRKVIVFVENGNLNINAPINVNDGIGFAGFFTEGNITVGTTLSGTAPQIEGIYLANGSFSTGESDTQLYVRGSVAAFGGFSLQRDLANDVTPAEVFEYAPDQILLFPEKLGYRQTRWAEIAP